MIWYKMEFTRKRYWKCCFNLCKVKEMDYLKAGEELAKE